ncbi:MAG: hypothetical protein IJ859_08410 [Synergistaceae bacterium]|nr:hypothetical protein [Synergistaceae bacterium]
MSYKFYGCEAAREVHAVNDEYKKIKTPLDLYDALLKIWCEYSCAPRMRNNWSEDDITIGQCSITAFLAQDIFGGKVFGIIRPSGDVHCYNDVDEKVFDLTSEQFHGEELVYRNNHEQFREKHFEAKPEKKERYEYLKTELLKMKKRIDLL